MGTVAPIVGSLGFVALLVGVLMFLPIGKLKSRRPLAKKLVIGGGVAFVIALILDPSPAPRGDPSPAQDTVQAAPPKSVASPKDVQPSVATIRPAQDSAEDVVGVTRQTIMSVIFCSGEIDNMQRAIDKVSAGTGAPTAAYTAATYAERDCRKMVVENAERNQEPFKGAALNKMYKDARRVCEAVPNLGVDAANIAKKVLDEDASLKVAQRYIDARAEIRSKVVECKMGLQAVADEGGVPKAEADFLET